MTPPARKGDGTGLAFKGFTEVRKGDGTVLWSANDIPDSGDLHAQYDATEITASDEDSVSTWSDATGNGYDLTATGSPTYKTSGINGNPVVGLDGTDDYFDVSWTAFSQPFSIYIVAQYPTASQSGEIFDGINASSNRHLFDSDGSDNLRMYTTTGITGSGADTNPHIFSTLWDGGNSTLRKDGTQDASGDVGTNDSAGITVGARGDQNAYGEVEIGEILIYPQDKSGIQSDIESYLSDKWGIAV